MLYILLISIAGMIYLDRIRRTYIQARVRYHQFRLYALRDDLRQLAMSGDVNSKNWVFLYLDSSIAKSIRVLDRLTIWDVIAINIINRDNRRFEIAHNHLRFELDKPNNSSLSDIYDQYLLSLGLFALDRHPTIKVALIKMFEALEIARTIRQRFDHLIMRLAEVPETSTLQDFAPGTP